MEKKNNMTKAYIVLVSMFWINILTYIILGQNWLNMFVAGFILGVLVMAILDERY